MDIISKSYLNTLCQLAQSDQHISPEEAEMIHQIGKKLNYSQYALDRLLKMPEPIGSLTALSEEKRFYLLQLCMDLILADGQLQIRKLMFLKGIALNLGFKIGVVEYLNLNYKKLPLSEIKKVILQQYQ